MRRVTALFLALGLVAGGCSSNPMDAPPPTIEPARAAQSPPVTAAPAGQILPLAGNPEAAVVDPATGALVVLSPGSAGEVSTLTIFDRAGNRRLVRLPGHSSAVTGDGGGSVLAATRGGFVAVGVSDGRVTPTPVADESDTDFTAIARRADGRLVLGSGGTVYTLAPDNTVAGRTDAFARVDAIAAQGDTAVVLDRGQTSVTALNPDGAPSQALRAGLGATAIAADPAGRILVADTRGGQLLVFGVDPLIERQAYPVGESPYGLAGSAALAWVSLTASNTVVGYDLSSGIPVEKVRYPTVQQPNALAFDEESGTLYVVSASGAGVQMIPDAGRPR